MKLIFATNNAHKLAEIQSAMKHLDQFEIISLKGIDCSDEIPETADTLEGNALQKAQFIYDRYGVSCFADDTGLEILALDGRPGVYSARYAGEGCSFDDNMDKILEELKGISDRRAKFRTVICLILEGKKYFFEGSVNGDILLQRSGSKGFGYDPVFRPEGYAVTFAEMDMSEKNKISHRGKALKELVRWLEGEW